MSENAKVGRVENFIRTNLEILPFVVVGESNPLHGNGSRRLLIRIKKGDVSEGVSNVKFVEDQVWAIKSAKSLPIFGFCFSRGGDLASTDHNPDEFFDVLFHEC